MTKQRIWPSYSAMIDEARAKIDADFRNVIGFASTRGNTQPPDETRVRELADDAFAFMIGVSAQQFPDRSQETAEILRHEFDELIGRILGDQPTLH